jgi:protein-S-isoprenylcysteine O-methyltransferase Ste14
MARLAALIYGAFAYLFFLLTFLYMIGFVGDVHVFPKTIDSGGGPFSTGALLVDLTLLALFAIQHSVMARPAFKRVWTRLVPAALERSTYVVLASASLDLLFWLWRPMTEVLWSVHSPAGLLATFGICGLGAVMGLVSSFLVGHMELFGLRQVRLYASAQPYTPMEFKIRSFYRQVRHPLYLGTLLTFWAAPQMTTGHLVFALAMTGYVLLAIPLEERELVQLIGERYRRYREDTPMLIPYLRWGRATPTAGEEGASPAALVGPPDPRAVRN